MAHQMNKRVVWFFVFPKEEQHIKTSPISVEHPKDCSCHKSEKEARKLDDPSTREWPAVTVWDAKNEEKPFPISVWDPRDGLPFVAENKAVKIMKNISSVSKPEEEFPIGVWDPKEGLPYCSKRDSNLKKHYAHDGWDAKRGDTLESWKIERK